jgi:hypothetical protein
MNRQNHSSAFASTMACLALKVALSACFLLLSLSANPTLAQDAHYWNLDYGPKASLLGGAVIGSVNDVSATFYNPGALSRAENLKLAVSTNVLESTRVSVVDGGGEGVDLGSSRTGLRPTMVGGTLTDSLGPGGVLSYSLLNRVKSDSELRASIVALPGEVPDDFDVYSLAGVYRLETNINDTWAGLTYSVPLGARLGLGITVYGTVRNQRRRVEETLNILSSPQTGSTSVRIFNVSTTTMGALAKAGVYFESERFTAGMTLTTPALQVYGKGEIGSGNSFTSSDSLLSFAGEQQGLDANHKYPLAIGAGVGIQFGKARLHGSTEWFEAINRYDVVAGEPITAIVPPGETITQVLPQELSTVLNWAVGIEYSAQPGLTLFASFAENNSGLSEDTQGPVMSLMTLDIKTAVAGLEMDVGPAMITLGIGYGRGQAPTGELSRLVGAIDDDFEATQRYRNLLGLFGFELK